MPLSPLLANFFLRPFDLEVEKINVSSIRYADDLILFFKDKQSARDGLSFVSEQLQKLKLLVPKLEDVDSKTELVGPREPVIFLGFEIAYDEQSSSYVRKIPKKVRNKILAEFRKFGDLNYCIKRKMDLFKLERRLHGMLHSYDSFYEPAVDWSRFNVRVRVEAERARERVFEELFGKNALTKLTAEKLDFLKLRELTFDTGDY